MSASMAKSLLGWVLVASVASAAVVPAAKAASVDAIAVSEHYVPMRQVVGSSPSTLRRRAMQDPPTKQHGTVGLSNAHDVYYIIDMTVGNETIAVSLDTGSSDTWLVQQPLQCVDFGGFRQRVRECTQLNVFPDEQSPSLLAKFELTL
jgi:predicted aspartyl protease